MKHFCTILLFLLVSNCTIGQVVFKSNNPAYKFNKFASEFYLFNDSTCYLKGHYLDHATYFLYKGELIKKSDTIYTFQFQPLVSFGSNMRFQIKDSIRVFLEQVDTVIPSLTYQFQSTSGRKIPIQLHSDWNTVSIKGM